MAEATEPDVVVVGNGIIGAAVMLRLASGGRRVLAVSPAAPAASATVASGAMLGVLGEHTAHDAPQELALRVDAWSRQPSWWDEIGLPAPSAGTFVVAGADRRDDLAALAAMEVAASKHGLRAERVAPGDIPGFAPAPAYRSSAALFLADEAWVDGPALRQAVTAAAVGHGATVEDGRVTEIEHQDGKVVGLRTLDGKRIRCREVVLCTGSAVPTLLRASRLDPALVPALVPAKGVSLVLEGQPGEVARGGLRYRNVLRTPNRQFACGLHIVPRGDGRVYVGSTNRAGERMPGARGRVTAGEVGQLLTDVTRELAGPLADWDIASMTYGLRPLPMDGTPVAGRTALDGLAVASGTYRNGLLLAPLVADTVQASLDGTGPGPLSPQRPAPNVDVTDLLRRGLRELLDHWRYDEEARWHEVLSPLLAGLAELAFDAGPEVEARRRQAAEFLRSHSRPEMVPEAVFDYLSARSENP